MKVFWDWWNSLSQGARDNIIGGLIAGAALAVVAAILKISWKSIRAEIIRRSIEASNQNQLPQPQRQEVIIKVEPHQIRPRIEELKPGSSPPAARAYANLPRPPLVGFVARLDKDGKEIIARLKEELAPRKNQLVALWGDGGVGKTTLAAETAREMTEVLASRIVWTSADGRPDFALSTLLDEIVTQLGEPEMRKLVLEPKKEAVRELIARSDTPTLIVLDNFETISADEQQQCAQWIADHGPCPALITTRRRVDGARNVPIDGMSKPEANEYNESLEIKKKLSHQSGIASTLHRLGMLAEEEGDDVEAARMFREALSIFEKLKSHYAEVTWQSLERVESKLN